MYAITAVVTDGNARVSVCTKGGYYVTIGICEYELRLYGKGICMSPYWRRRRDGSNPIVLGRATSGSGTPHWMLNCQGNFTTPLEVLRRINSVVRDGWRRKRMKEILIERGLAPKISVA